MIRNYPSHSAGFTLLELIVSLAVFALLAAMSYSGLNNVLNTRQKTEQKADKLIELQRTMTFLARDIQQAINRPIRDEFGSPDPMPPLIGYDIGDYLLELTRTGWRNPADFARSNLQRVAWGMEEEKLQRAYWLALDRAQDTPVIKQTMLDGVKEIEFRYMDEQSSWTNTWPKQNFTGSGAPPPDLPKAIEVTLEHKEFGKIKRLFVLPG